MTIFDSIVRATTSFFRSDAPAAAVDEGRNRRPPGGEEALADTSRLFSTGPSIAYNPDEIIGRYGFRRIDEMRRDDQIRAALAFKQHAIIASGWYIESPEDAPEGWEPAEFCEKSLQKIDGTLECILIEIMTAMPFGFSITEKIWDERDGRVVISALKTRHPQDIRFEQDGYGNIISIRQGIKTLTREKYVLWSYDSEFSNPYGRTDLKAAYRPWWAKRNAYNWLSMLLERLGIPPIFALYDSTSYQNEQPAAIQNLLSKMRAATTAAIPRPNKDALELWSAGIKGEVSAVFVPAITMYNKDIARSILMPGLLGATPDDAQGSFARAQKHFDVFMLVIDRLRAEIAERVMQEQIIVPLCQANFGILPEYPKFVFKPINDEVRIDLAQAWGVLTGQAVVTNTADDEKHVRSMLKFPEMSPEAQRMRAEAEKAKQEAAARAQQPPLQGKEEETPPGEKSMALRRYAAYIDMARIASDLDRAETEMVRTVRSAIKVSLDEMLRLIHRDFDPSKARISWVERLELRKWRDVQTAMVEGMRGALDAGRNAIRRETGLPRAYDTGITVSPNAAIRAMSDKAMWVSGIMKQRLISEAQEILVQAIKNGESVSETINKIRESWLPYLGDDTIIVDEQQITPHRLETIVRTNLTDAYNTGRLTEMRDPDLDPYMLGVRYSAILDTRTTPVCELLHGAVFRRDDPDLDKLTPPNHFNCRSLLTPVMITETVKAEEWATAERIGRALDLMDAGFGGAAKYSAHHYEFDESLHPRAPAGDEHGGEFVSSGSMTASGAANDEQRERLKAMRIPPAWRDVQISADPKAALQVTGIDSKGRKQYVYSAEHSERMAALKFERLKTFAAEAPGISGKARADMRAGDHTAGALYLIAQTGIRVGSDADTGAAVKAYGATTLLGSHVKVRGDEVHLSFVGKKGVQIDKTINDPHLARFIKERGAGANERVFNTSDSRVREYLKRAGGNDEFKVKDFRTWHGTAKAIDMIKREMISGSPKNAKERAAIVTRVSKGVAAHLGNTPSVARAAYIDPAVWGMVR